MAADRADVKNYFKLRRFSLLFDYYCYADLPDYYADGLFIKHKVQIWYGDEWAHPDHRFRFIFCKCLKWKSNRFRAAMKELPNIMSYNGIREYDDFCERFVERLKSERK